MSRQMICFKRKAGEWLMASNAVSHGLSRNNAGATKLVAGTGDAGIQTDSVYEKLQIVRD
jgi:ATP sulfurylase